MKYCVQRHDTKAGRFEWLRSIPSEEGLVVRGEAEWTTKPSEAFDFHDWPTAAALRGKERAAEAHLVATNAAKLVEGGRAVRFGDAPEEEGVDFRAAERDRVKASREKHHEDHGPSLRGSRESRAEADSGRDEREEREHQAHQKDAAAELALRQVSKERRQEAALRMALRPKRARAEASVPSMEETIPPPDAEEQPPELAPIDAQRIATYEASSAEHAEAKKERDARRATYTPEARAKAAEAAWVRRQAALRARRAIAKERQTIGETISTKGISQ